MSRAHPAAEHLRAVFNYLRLRRAKGLLGADQLVKNLAFAGARLWGPRRTNGRSPLIATLAVTSRCPCNCLHCSEGYQGGYELPRAALDQTIDDLVNLGCPVIALTGGEPFFRSDFMDLLERVPASTASIIYTSGIGLSPELARRLQKKANLFVCFSLDHSEPDEHDRRRRRKGAHQAVLQGLSLLNKGKAELHVSTLVTRDRLQSGELSEFIRLTRKWGAACVQVFQPRPVGRLFGERAGLLTPNEERELFTIADEMNRDPEAPLVVACPALEQPDMLGCCGGYARVYVDSHGHVCPCDFAPLSFGRITDEPFAQIWSRMRTFFETPGSRCLVRDHPEVFARAREGRNLIFSELSDPETLQSPPPGVYQRFNEKFYRALIPNLLLATSALPRFRNDPHE